MVQSWRKKRQPNSFPVFPFSCGAWLLGEKPALGVRVYAVLSWPKRGVSGNTAVEWRQRLLDVMLMLDAGKDGQGRLLVERIGSRECKCKELRVLVPSSP